MSETKERVDEHRLSIIIKVKKIIEAVDKLADDKDLNWGHVGSLHHVDDELDDVCEFLNVKL
jgi:hypothetical protein